MSDKKEEVKEIKFHTIYKKDGKSLKVNSDMFSLLKSGHKSMSMFSTSKPS